MCFIKKYKFIKNSYYFKIIKLSILLIPMCYTFSVSKYMNVKNNKKLKLINNKFNCIKNTSASIFELFVILDIMLPLYFE